MSLLQPVPDLTAGDLHLRLWRPGDGGALSAAWHDPEIVAGSDPPPDRSVAAAERWIAGAAARWERSLAFDLVVELGGEIVGEVGLARLDPQRGAAEIGWWVAAPHRGAGIASAAVAEVTTWALAAGGLRAVFARIGVDNAASVAVAGHAGFRPVDQSRNPQEKVGGDGAPLWYVALSTVK